MGFTHDLKKFKPRQIQQDTLDFIDKEYKANTLNKFFLLDLPVGVGKSHLSLMITDWYRKNVNRSARVDIITNTKILQDQYTDTYDSLNDLKGKSNYYCSEYDCNCEQALELHRLNKTKPDECCEYIPAREGYMKGGISLTNFYLHILYALYNQNVMEARGADVLIVDEAHNLDDVMSDFISVKINLNTIKKYKFGDEKDLLSEFKAIKNISQYITFLNKLNISMTETIETLTEFLNPDGISRQREVKLAQIMNRSTNESKFISLLTDLTQLSSKVNTFLEEYKNDENNWVMEISYDEGKSRSLSLEPIWAYDYLDKYIFSKYKMVFLMSGSILSKNIFCNLNGISITESVYYSISSPFRLENRPIYYMPIGKMSYTQKENTFKQYIPYIGKILKKYEHKKGIIHTNSFELQNWINESVKNDRLLFHDSKNKDEMFDFHKRAEKASVIVSPSMDTGVSFDDDYARFQIIAKVPYPSLASQKNKLRQKNNPEWYSWKTVANLCQMFGRPVRSYTDYADTIILDSSFGDVIKYSGHLIPIYFQEAIKKVNVK